MSKTPHEDMWENGKKPNDSDFHSHLEKQGKSTSNPRGFGGKRKKFMCIGVISMT